MSRLRTEVVDCAGWWRRTTGRTDAPIARI
jgi:hypothetical protein